MNLYEWQEIDGRLSLYFKELNERLNLDRNADWSYHLRQRYAITKESFAKTLGLKGGITGLQAWG